MRFLLLAPGTYGSILTTCFWVACRLYQQEIFIQMLFSVLCTITALYGVYRLVPLGATEQDPSWFVLDEVAGMSVSLWGAYTRLDIFYALIIFRFFDISKIMGIRACEKIFYPWGIICDDIVAGLYTVGLRLCFSYIHFW